MADTTFAERLKFARELRGYTRNALSERADLSRNSVLHLEDNPDASPKLSTVTALASALEVDEAWLATGTGKAPKAGKKRNADAA